MTAILQPPPPGAVQDQQGHIYPAWDAWFRQVLYRSIAQTIPGAIPVASVVPPLMDGGASAGNSTEWAPGNHRHPTDTSRAAVTSLPTATSLTPSMNGVGTIGVDGHWSDGAHVHPTDTSRAPAISPNFTVGISFGGTQILTSQQTGLGTTLGAATAGALYTAAEQTMLQNAYNKILALETKLKVHGLVAT
jgi:hypothetical protein